MQCKDIDDVVFLYCVMCAQWERSVEWQQDWYWSAEDVLYPWCHWWDLEYIAEALDVPMNLIIAKAHQLNARRFLWCCWHGSNRPSRQCRGDIQITLAGLDFLIAHAERLVESGTRLGTP